MLLMSQSGVERFNAFITFKLIMMTKRQRSSATRDLSLKLKAEMKLLKLLLGRFECLRLKTDCFTQGFSNCLLKTYSKFVNENFMKLHRTRSNASSRDCQRIKNCWMSWNVSMALKRNFCRSVTFCCYRKKCYIKYGRSLMGSNICGT